MSVSDVAEILYRHANYNAIHSAIASSYMDHFETWLNAETGLSIKLTFTDLQSPREYNFLTDRIFTNISAEDVYKLYNYVDIPKLQEMASKLFTSCSGFISFYDPDIGAWPDDLLEWDHNQLYALLLAVCEEFEDWDLSVFYSMYDAIYDAWSNSVDWARVKLDIENAEDEAYGADCRKYPSGKVLDVAEYVQQFERLNHFAGTDPE